MSETPSLSADERVELERLRSEAGDPALAGAGWGAKPTRPRAAVGAAAVADHRGHPVRLGLAAVAPQDWPKGSTWLLERASQRLVDTHYLASLALGGRVESANGPVPLTDGGIEDLA
jgi:hypothetical protein